MRSLISDFAVFTSIMIMVAVDALVGLDTPKLEVPSNFRVSVHDHTKLLIICSRPYYDYLILIVRNDDCVYSQHAKTEAG